METSSTKPIIIEFFGTPGCGKSTTSNFLKEKLEGRGFKCFRSYYKNDFFKNKCVKMFMPLNFRLLYNLFRFSIKQKKIVETFPGILAVCQYNQMYRMFSSKYEGENNVLVIDQGIIQGFLSIAHLNNFNNLKDVVAILNTLNISPFQYVVVYCNVLPETSMRRLKKRQQQNGRLDKLDGKELFQAICVQYENTKNIYKELVEYDRLKLLEINMEDDVIKNVDIILETICN